MKEISVNVYGNDKMPVEEVSTFKFDVFGKVREVVKVKLKEPRKEFLVVDIHPREDRPRDIDNIIRKLEGENYKCTADMDSMKLLCTLEA